LPDAIPSGTVPGRAEAGGEAAKVTVELVTIEDAVPA
jgi:hypothetical protein